MQTIEDIGLYTFPALFKNSLSRYSDRNALSLVSGTPVTYGELGRRVDTARRLLHRFGITKGSRVALFSGSMPNWGAAYFSIVNSGAVAVPLLPDFSPKEIEIILAHAEVSGMFVSEKLYEKVKDLPDSLLPFIIRVDDFAVLRGELPAEKPEDRELPDADIDEQDTASIIYTSGTTGRSKGVELSHKNLVFTAIQCQTCHRVNKFDKALSFLPLSHVYEFTIGFVMQMLNGSCVYYLEKPPTVSSLLPALGKIRPTVILSVPIVMEKIYKNKIVPTFTKTAGIRKLYGIRFFQRILHRIAGKSLKKTFGGRIKFFGIGGAKIDPLVEQFMKDAHFPYAIGYGLTETSPLVAGSSPYKTIVGTIGPVMKGCEVRILDPDAQTGIGEIAVKGPNVMKGYYRDKELTASVFTEDGWFKTGDLGRFEKKHFLSLKGRLKNMILGASGENIYPEDIEFVLNQHPWVNESLVVEDDNGLVAFVQLNEDKIAEDAKKSSPGLSLESMSNAVGEAVNDLKEGFMYKQEELLNEIKYFVNENVSRFSKIGRVQKVDTFEKTASQKIKRYLYNLKHGDRAADSKNEKSKETKDTGEKEKK